MLFSCDENYKDIEDYEEVGNWELIVGGIIAVDGGGGICDNVEAGIWFACAWCVINLFNVNSSSVSCI